jgi:hypothetical protein
MTTANDIFRDIDIAATLDIDPVYVNTICAQDQGHARPREVGHSQGRESARQ